MPDANYRGGIAQGFKVHHATRWERRLLEEAVERGKVTTSFAWAATPFASEIADKAIGRPPIRTCRA